MTYYEATGNERVLPFLKKFFKNQFNTHTVSAMWFDSRARLLEEIEAIDAVYKETDLEWLHDLGEILRDASCDWFKIASRFPYKKPYNRYISQTALKHVQKVVLNGESVEKAAKRHKPFTPEYADKEWKKRAHQRAVTTSGVNIAKAIKYPVTYGRFIGDKDLSLISLKMISALEKHYGTPIGAFSCSPRLASNKGVCAVDVESAVEMMESLVEVIRETRDYHAVDLLEKIAFNLVPGACFEDCSAVQDTVFVNQVEASASRKLPYSDAVGSFFTKKASRGAIAALSAYPIYMQAACMTCDNELNFLTYTPCIMDIAVGGAILTIAERTGYPFRNTVVFKVEQATVDTEVKINFRVPGGTMMQLISGGQVVASGTKEISVKCILKTGSTFMLKMNIPLAVEENSDGSESLYKGNLLMSLKLPYEITQDAQDRRMLYVKSLKNGTSLPFSQERAAQNRCMKKKGRK